jgi:hypothetical protein
MIPVSVLKISYHPESRSYAVILKELFVIWLSDKNEIQELSTDRRLHNQF